MTSRSIGFELFYSKLFLAHDFFLCRLNISQICVLDYYGGPHYVPVDEYFRVKLDSDIKKGKLLRMNHARVDLLRLLPKILSSTLCLTYRKN